MFWPNARNIKYIEIVSWTDVKVIATSLPKLIWNQDLIKIYMFPRFAAILVNL